MEKLDRITINPNICLGQPTIRGMRITVSVILKMLAAGRSVKDVLEAYPELEAEDFRQECLRKAKPLDVNLKHSVICRCGQMF